jgi:CAI-1 autoinducer synthase
LRQRYEEEFVPRWQNEWGGKSIVQNRPAGPDAVRLEGNDYLGISGHQDIVNAYINTLRRDNAFVVQSSVFLVEEHPCRVLEKSLAAWVCKEDGFICQSGYMANVGLIQAIADEQTPVYLDALAHTSLWEGARAARAPAYVFRHNDPEHLDRMMKRHGPGLVVVDSVYSTTGAMCPLKRMIEVTESNASMILVDESHSLGTHGPGGAGICVELGLSDRVHFITASLAKAFAGRAGFFTVPLELRYYVLHRSFPNVFSSSLLPHEIAGLMATLKVIQGADNARQRLRENTVRLRCSLSEIGYPIHQGTEQIIALEAGTEVATSALRDLLEDGGVFGAIFCAPATSTNRAMVRLTVNALLTDAELTRVEDVARRIAPVVRPWEWTIARRGRTPHTTSENGH